MWFIRRLAGKKGGIITLPNAGTGARASPNTIAAHARITAELLIGIEGLALPLAPVPQESRQAAGVPVSGEPSRE